MEMFYSYSCLRLASACVLGEGCDDAVCVLRVDGCDVRDTRSC